MLYDFSDEEEEELSCFYRTALYFVEYTRIAEIHGIRYLSRRMAFERLLWGIITLCFVLICISNIIKLSSKLYNFPVLIAFDNEIGSLHEIPFPAVTICPEVKTVKKVFDYQDVSKRIDSKENVTYEEQLTREYLSVICDDDTKRESAYFSEDFYTKMNKISLNLSHIAGKCSWKENTVQCSDIFTRIFTEEGVCYSFNFVDKKHIFQKETFLPKDTFISKNTLNHWNFLLGYSNNPNLNTYPRRVLRSGDDHALSLTLRLNRSDFDILCRPQFQGFKVSIHSPLEIPRIRSNSFQIAPNHVYMAAVRPSLIVTSAKAQKFPSHTRDCFMKNEKPLKFFKIYSESNCLLECYSIFSYSKCGCVAFYMPRSSNMRICGGAKDSCIINAEREVKRKNTVSKLKDKDVPSYCNCLPSCTKLSYDVEVTMSTSQHLEETKNEELKTLFLMVYYKYDDFLKLKRSEAFNALTLIANIGGLIGLYLGASILTAIEFLYFWSVRMICNYRLFGDFMEPKPLI